jgi:hypothetical protein
VEEDTAGVSADGLAVQGLDPVRADPILSLQEANANFPIDVFETKAMSGLL